MFSRAFRHAGEGKGIEAVYLGLGQQKNFFSGTGEGIEVEMRVEEPIKLSQLRYLMWTFFGAVTFSFVLFIVGRSFSREIVMKSLIPRKSVGNRNRINRDQNWLNVFSTGSHMCKS